MPAPPPAGPPALHTWALPCGAGSFAKAGVLLPLRLETPWVPRFQIDTKPSRQSWLQCFPPLGSTCLPGPLPAPQWPQNSSELSCGAFLLGVCAPHPRMPCACKATPRAAHRSSPGSSWPRPWGWNLGWTQGCPFPPGILQCLSPHPLPREKAKGSQRRGQIKGKGDLSSGRLGWHFLHTGGPHHEVLSLSQGSYCRPGHLGRGRGQENGGGASSPPTPGVPACPVAGPHSHLCGLGIQPGGKVLLPGVRVEGDSEPLPCRESQGVPAGGGAGVQVRSKAPSRE